MDKVIDYFMAPTSPYAYLGHDRFVALAARHSAQVRLKPFDLGKVFPLSGGLPLPKRAPQRQAYRLIELRRWSELTGLPLNLHPKFFPASGDDAARMIIAADERHGVEQALALAGATLRAVWAEEQNIADTSVLAALAERCGLDGKTLLDTAPAMQARYDANTQDAIDAQVFGAPWYVYRGEPFWGQDRLDLLERALTRS